MLKSSWFARFLSTQPQQPEERKEPRFLLPETSILYRGFYEETKRKWQEDCSSVRGAARQLVAQAESLEWMAVNTEASDESSVFVKELYRRKNWKRKHDADNLRVQAGEMMEQAAWLESESRMLPEGFVPGGEFPPLKHSIYLHWNDVAEKKARRREWEEIYANGIHVFLKAWDDPVGSVNMLRKIVLYKGRFFVCQFKTPADKKGWIQFVDDDVHRMEDEELEALQAIKANN